MNAVDGPKGRAEAASDVIDVGLAASGREDADDASAGAPPIVRGASADISVEPMPIGRTGTSGVISVAADPSGRDVGVADCAISELIAAVSGDALLRLSGENWPHQSSSRTLGQMPSTMYVLADVGCTIGPDRRHLPQRTPRSEVCA
jgi:hypothetical protein